MAAFERLSAQDAAFLAIEDDTTPMHVAATGIFDATPVRGPDGRLPIEAIRALIASRLHLLPRYRMRIARTPVTGHPVWVDDAFFDLRHHLRYVTLPRPGDLQTLDELVSVFLSQKLDRARPLWEILVADGLEGGRAAAVIKAHHALIDGVSGVEMMLLLLSGAPSSEVAAPTAWTPRSAPGAGDLVAGELRGRIGSPGAWLGAARDAWGDPRASLGAVRDRALGLSQTLRAALNAGPPTPLNASLGPNRRLRMLRVELEEVKRLRREFGGTVNDVAVAIVAGGLRRYLAMRGAAVDGLELRATIPMSTRTEADRGTLGNKLAVLVAGLPVGEPDARRRLGAVQDTMDRLKASKEALGTDVLTRLAEWTSPALLAHAVRLPLRLRASHVMITNIRGPAQTLYCLTAPLLEVYPASPLWPQQVLAVAVLSYGGFLHWGFVADADRLPDVEDLVDAVRSEIAELGKIASETADIRSDRLA